MYRFRCEFDASGCVEVVQELVAYIFQCFQGSLLSEVVEVPPQFAAFQEASFAEYSLHTQIKWDVKDLQITFRPDSVQKAEIVFDVFEDIEDQNQIEECVFLPTDVSQFELKFFICPALAHLHGLRRDVVTPETARVVHLLLQQPEHFARTTSDLAYGRRLQMVFL